MKFPVKADAPHDGKLLCQCTEPGKDRSRNHTGDLHDLRIKTTDNKWHVFQACDNHLGNYMLTADFFDIVHICHPGQPKVTEKSHQQYLLDRFNDALKQIWNTKEKLEAVFVPYEVAQGFRLDLSKCEPGKPVIITPEGCFTFDPEMLNEQHGKNPGSN